MVLPKDLALYPLGAWTIFMYSCKLDHAKCDGMCYMMEQSARPQQMDNVKLCHETRYSFQNIIKVLVAAEIGQNYANLKSLFNNKKKNKL